MSKRWISILLCCAMIFAMPLFANANFDEHRAELIMTESISPGNTGYINGIAVNFRSGPSTSNWSYGKVYMPDSFTVVTAYNSNWYKVSMTSGGFNHYTGCVYGDYVREGTSVNKWKVVAVHGANLRSGAGVNNPALKQVSYGDQFYIVDDQYNSSDQHTWYKVHMTTGTNSGSVGWLQNAQDILACT